jgi:cobalamin biosynthesis protein CbiG
MTGFAERRGSRSAPELHRAAHARCSRAQIAAVMAGFVRVGFVIMKAVASNVRCSKAMLLSVATLLRSLKQKMARSMSNVKFPRSIGRRCALRSDVTSCRRKLDVVLSAQSFYITGWHVSQTCQSLYVESDAYGAEDA